MFKGGNGAWWKILERRRKGHHMKGDIIWSWWYRCGKTYHDGMRTGEWAPTIAYCCKGWTSLGNFLEPTLMAMTGEIWQADQVCDFTGPETVLWVDPLQNPPYLYSARAREGAVPEYPKVQDLYNTGQQQAI